VNPSISPTPSDEEAVAITAAMEFAWPKPVMVAESADTSGRRASAWRFSGRWWTKPQITRRDRP
jgi:hypothetical protein